MQKKLIKYYKLLGLFALICLAGMSFFLTSCQKDKEDSKVALYSFGPLPIARGAELKFIGSNLDKVTSVVIPNNIEVSTFTSQSSELLTLTVPQTAIPGYVVLKTPDGNITTKTELGFTEPISFSGFTPATIKPGSVLTINGDYLNLVGAVLFTSNVSVDSTAFLTQSRKQITLAVPATAQTGKIAISNAAADPIIVYATSELTVTLPAFTSITPNPVKAGTALTIAGTDLDLVKSVVLGGDKTVTAFTSQTTSQIVLNVPAEAKDGVVTMIPASGVKVVSADPLLMVVPTVSVAPTTLKNGANITVTGSDLDLISTVTFGGAKAGTILAGGTATQITVKVPDDAVTGIVTFGTKAAKTVDGPVITMILPTVTSIAPASGKPSTSVTITGTDLDLVTTATFNGGIKGAITSQSLTQLVVTVPVGAKTGAITLNTKNGSTVTTGSYEVLSNLPNISGYDEAKGTPGQILTINGTNMLLIKELVFPGNVYATAYGAKTDTKIQVYVPTTVTPGFGQIRMITYEGEEGLLPELFFGGTDPVLDPSLVITDFEADFNNSCYWGGIAATGNDAAYALSGKYMHGTSSSVSGWQWVWGCNWVAFPSVTKADYYLKMDVRLDKPLGGTNVEFQMELGGTRISIIDMGLTTATTVGWVTVTFDLSTYSALPDVIPSGGEWGINTNYYGGPIDLTGLYIDNIRFEHK
jgi:hypothetical protein